MAPSRRRVLALLPALALPGCSALTNDAIELAVENRSQADQRVVAYVHPPGAERGDPVYDGTLPRGSRIIVGDVTEAPVDGSKEVVVVVDAETAEATETVTVTGPGTIAAMLTGSGVDIEFGRRD